MDTPTNLDTLIVALDTIGIRYRIVDDGAFIYVLMQHEQVQAQFNLDRSFRQFITY